MRPRRTIIIAELGENHVGDMARARQMVVEAARAGADLVKLQSYRGQDVARTDPEKAWFERVQLPDDEHFALKALAEREGVGFVSAPFSVERAQFLCERLGLTQIKIASSELLNLPLLDYVNRHAQTVYLSTGMATLGEIAEAVSHLRAVGHRAILQCTSLYPAPPEEVNLRVLSTLAKRFPDCRIGYSDHTIGLHAVLAAVALGAQVIEKHFTLDKRLEGTDQICSTEPAELRAMVEGIRMIERLLGSAVKRPTSGEEAIKAVFRGRFPKDVAPHLTERPHDALGSGLQAPGKRQEARARNQEP